MPPQVKILSGANEIREHTTEIVNAAKESGVSLIYGITNLDEVKKLFPEYEFSTSNPSREEAKIPSRLIYTCSEGPVLSSMDHINNRTSRFLPLDNYGFTSDIGVIGDITFFTILGGETAYALSVTSPKLAEDMRSFFHCLWNAIPVR